MKKIFFLAIITMLKSSPFPDSLCTTINTSDHQSTHHENLMVINKEYNQAPKKQSISYKKTAITIGAICALLVSSYIANQKIKKNKEIV